MGQSIVDIKRHCLVNSLKNLSLAAKYEWKNIDICPFQYCYMLGIGGCIFLKHFYLQWQFTVYLFYQNNQVLFFFMFYPRKLLSVIYFPKHIDFIFSSQTSTYSISCCEMTFPFRHQCKITLTQVYLQILSIFLLIFLRIPIVIHSSIETYKVETN